MKSLMKWTASLPVNQSRTSVRATSDGKIVPVVNDRKRVRVKTQKKQSIKQPAKRQPVFVWLVMLLMLAGSVGSFYYLALQRRMPNLPPPPDDALYKQANQPIDERVEDLLSYMTLEEKIGQIALVDKNSLKKLEDISRYSLGGMLSGGGAKPADNTPANWFSMVDGMKRQARKSRLGIPIFYGVDANHGHSNVPGATIFPHAIGLGATADLTLTEAVAAATSQELAAIGINWNFSPAVDVPEDIRWGRVYESFSSSPVLNGGLGAAYVKGTSRGDKPSVISSVKHFIAAGSMQWGSSNNKNFKIDQGRSPADEANLSERDLLPFKMAIDAGAHSVMVGLNYWGDKRVIDNPYLLTDTLKGEMGFKGFVVSDWYGVYEFAGTNNHRANVSAINAGVDMAMLPYDYKSFIHSVRNAVRRGEIAQTRIDDAVRRILTQKFQAGLFDHEPKSQLAKIGAIEHRTLARQAVVQSAVPLKNDKVLPITKSAKRLFVAGGAADNIGRQAGGWTVEWQGVDGNWLPGGQSILAGMREAVGSDTAIEYDKDAEFSSDTRADIGVAVVGEKPYAEGWGDNPEPSLDEADRDVIRRLRANSDKLLIIVVSGRPLFMTEQIHMADAVVAVWLPGSEGGGIADVVFGKQPFSGRLPIAWPRSVSQLPINSSGQTADGSPPLFERGFTVNR